MSPWVSILICGFCMQNSDFSTRIASLYGSQPSSVVFAFKTATLAPELQISKGPSSHLCFLFAKQPLLGQNYKSLWVPDITAVVLCMPNNVISIRITSLCGSQPSSVALACKTASFGSEILVSMGPRPHLTFCAWKTTWLVAELLVSMGPTPHLWSFHAKQRLLDQNYKSLWVPDLTCRFVHAKQRD